MRKPFMLLMCGLFMTTLFSCTPERITEEFDEQQTCCSETIILPKPPQSPPPPPPAEETDQK